MAKEYHIVYSEQAEAILKQSGSLNFSNSNVELITLIDNLTEGRLFNFKTLVGLDERSRWFEEFYGVDHWADLRREKVIEYQLTLSKIQSNDKVYIWLGNEGNEYIWKATILDFLSDVNLLIYVIDWNNLTFYKQDGGEMKLYALNLCNPENALIAGRNFRLLNSDEKSYFVDLWNTLLLSNSDLRVLNSTVLEQVDVSFCDEVLLNRCTTEFQKGSYVVGMTLCDIYDKYKGAGISDCFLFERLEQLAEMGKLEIVDMVIREFGYANLFNVRIRK